MANFTVPFFSGTERNGTEQNGKKAFILAPRKVVEWLERFSLCSVNAVKYIMSVDTNLLAGTKFSDFMISEYYCSRTEIFRGIIFNELFF